MNSQPLIEKILLSHCPVSGAGANLTNQTGLQEVRGRQTIGCGGDSAGDYIQTLVLGSGHEDIFPLAAEGAI